MIRLGAILPYACVLASIDDLLPVLTAIVMLSFILMFCTMQSPVSFMHVCFQVTFVRY